MSHSTTSVPLTAALRTWLNRREFKVATESSPLPTVPGYGGLWLTNNQKVPVAVYVAEAQESSKLGVTAVALLREAVTPLTHCIIVICPGISHQAAEAARISPYIEIIPRHVIAFDLMASRLVPRYEVLMEAEICEIERRKCIKRVNFSQMRRTDPVATYMGWQVGLVLRNLDADELRIVVA